jgi:uncharacterized protein (TIGR03083 family)
MDLWTAQPMDTRPLFTDERADLLSLLDELSPEDWLFPTAATGWTVKDVALHLLDGDFGRLSRGRDGDNTSLLPTTADAASYAAALAAKNQRWIEATRGLSSRIIRELLTYSTAQLQEWTAAIDLLAPARVSWASDSPVPGWLDLARELTESWVHHQQIRAALNRATDVRRLPSVLRTFVWALPHQYRVTAAKGTTVVVDLDLGGTWLLVSQGDNRWTLEEDFTGSPEASLSFTGEAAWRSFTGAVVPQDGVHRSGPRELTEPLLQVRGIIT